MKRAIVLVLILIVVSAGCTQNSDINQPTSAPTTDESMTNATFSSPANLSNPSNNSSPRPKLPKELLESFDIKVSYNDDADALVIYLEVRNQTDSIRINGTLNLTIKDKYGFLIYNESIEVRKSDFEPYTEEFTGLDDKLHNITHYKARYIIPHPRKGLASEGYVHAILFAGNQTLKKDFITHDLPEMPNDEKEAYFENLYLHNSKVLNMTQKQGELQVEVYRYGVYTNPEDLKKYLRVDVRIHNTANYTVEIDKLTLGPLVVDGYPVKAVQDQDYFLGELAKDEYIKKSLLFPLSEIPLNHQNLTLKLTVEEYLSDQEMLVSLDEFPIKISRYPLSITIQNLTTGTVVLWGVEEGIVTNVTVMVRNNEDSAITIPFFSWKLSGELPLFDSKVPYDIPAYSEAQAILTYYFDQEPESWTLRIVFPSTQRELQFEVTLPPLSLS